MHNMELFIDDKQIRFTFLLQPIMGNNLSKVVGFECLSNLSQTDSSEVIDKEFFFENLHPSFLKEIIYSQIKELNDFHFGEKFVSINMPISLVNDYDFFNKIIKMAKFNIAIEITTIDIEMSKIKHLKDEMRRTQKNDNVTFLFDDFVHNEKDINILKLLPWDIIKLDKSVIDNDTKLLNSIEVCKKLGFEENNIIVEGVESKFHHLNIIKHSCYAQGYFYGFPLEINMHPKESSFY